MIERVLTVTLAVRNLSGQDEALVTDSLAEVT